MTLQIVTALLPVVHSRDTLQELRLHSACQRLCLGMAGGVQVQWVWKQFNWCMGTAFPSCSFYQTTYLQESQSHLTCP